MPPAWTKLHRRWLAGLRFEQAVHHIVLEDYIAAVEAAETRRDRLTAQIETMLPDWTLAPVVAALQTMRGMAPVNAATLIAELSDAATSDAGAARVVRRHQPEIGHQLAWIGKT
jgi:transposase